MPDAENNPPPSPEIPGLTSATDPGHVTDPTANPPGKTTLAQKIRRAGESVFSAAGIAYKRGRGRPRKDGQPAALDQPLAPGAAAGGPVEPAGPAVAVGTAAVNPAAVAMVDPPGDALFTRSVVSAVKGALSFAKRLCRKKAGAAGLDADFTERALRESEPENEVMKDFSDSLETVLKKYNVKTEYSPEIALAVSTARLAAPYWLLLQTFNAEIARRKSAEMGGK